MKILVIGSGGREHAIVWKLSQSPKAPKIYCAPGNAGIGQLAQLVPIGAMEFDKLIAFSKYEEIDLVIISIDDCLANGAVDAFEAAGIRTFGARANAAKIESSKAFAKQLMKKYDIPTAKYEVFERSDDAIEYVKSQNTYPMVIKADGLALGKGVVIAENFDEAATTISEILDAKIFGSSGNRVVIETFLSGTEVSVLAFTDGKTIVPMVSSQDHKRAYDNNVGPNTGGMGAFAPSGVFTKDDEKVCLEEIFVPTIKALAQEGRQFQGVLYFGLIKTDDGYKVIEYNARFGDPEAQVVLPLLKTDLIEICEAVIDGNLNKIQIEWQDGSAACVVLASGGYPRAYETGFEITGIEGAVDMGATVFHAGTKNVDGEIVTAGGRVLGITALGKTHDETINAVYKMAAEVDFCCKHMRHDIGRM